VVWHVLLYGGSVGPLIAISLRSLVSVIIPPFWDSSYEKWRIKRTSRQCEPNRVV